MNRTLLYPGKSRIYSPGRWEAWNRLPSADCDTKNYLKVKKIRGLHSISPGKEEKISNRYTETRTADKVHINSSNVKKNYLRPKKKNTEFQNNFINLPNLNQTNTFISNTHFFQEYTYGINIKGNKFISNTIINNKRVYEISPLKIRKELKKKSHDFHYNFSLNNTPTPWNVPIKSSIELN